MMNSAVLAPYAFGLLFLFTGKPEVTELLSR